MSFKWPYVINCHDCGYMEAFRKETNREYRRGYHSGKKGHDMEVYKVDNRLGLPDLLQHLAEKYQGAQTLDPRLEDVKGNPQTENDNK